jgi:hypothetical protein
LTLGSVNLIFNKAELLNTASTQDIEADVLPWIDDMARSITLEATKPDTPEDITKKLSAVKELMKDVESRKVDVDDVATFGESALELVTSYDPDNMCQSAIDLGAHLKDVQKRLDCYQGYQ